jgi:carbon monoxide dehydrogenase subunit G
VIEATADAVVPVPPAEAFAALTDLEHATWLPGIRSLRHVGGPPRGRGARYEAEIDALGRRLHGVLVCTEAVAPRRTVMALEDGLELSITGTVAPAAGGSRVELTARFAVGGGLAGRAIERASALPARRQVARAVEQLAAQFDHPGPSRG